MQLKDFIYENIQVKPSDYPEVDKFLNDVMGEFKKSFPNGNFIGKISKGLGETITLTFGIGYASNGIGMNDNMYHSIMIHPDSKTEDFTGDKLELSSLQGGINIQPPKGSHLAMGRVKTKFANSKGKTLAKHGEYIKKWFPKLLKLMQDNQDNLYDGGDPDDRSKLRKDLRV